LWLFLVCWLLVLDVVVLGIAFDLLALEQRARVIDVALHMALVAFNSDLVCLDARLNILLPLLLKL